MQSVKVKMVDGGRIIVPAAFRKAMGIESGDTVVLELDDFELRVRSPRTALRRLQERLRALPPSDTLASDDLIAERRAEAARG